MMNELLTRQGQLEEAERKFDQLDMAASAYVIELRNLIDPFEEDPRRLNVEEAQKKMNALFETVHEMRSVYKRIEELKQALGKK